MSLVVGITSGVWVWSSKTVFIWKRFFKSCCSSNDQFHKSPGVSRHHQISENFPSNQHHPSWNKTHQFPHLTPSRQPRRSQQQYLLPMDEMNHRPLIVQPMMASSKQSTPRTDYLYRSSDGHQSSNPHDITQSADL